MSLTHSFAAIVEPLRRSTVQVRVGRRELVRESFGDRVGDGMTIEFLRGGQHLSQNVILESRHSEAQAA